LDNLVAILRKNSRAKWLKLESLDSFQKNENKGKKFLNFKNGEFHIGRFYPSTLFSQGDDI
jgi:hypothetical protein